MHHTVVMKAFTILQLLVLANVHAFSPSGGVDRRIRRKSQNSEAFPIEILNGESTILPVSSASVGVVETFPSAMQPGNLTGLFSSPETQVSAKRKEYFLGLPVEIDDDLTTDQIILGEVLKEPTIEVVSGMLVLLSSFLVALSTLNTIDLKTVAMILRAENLIATIFAIEFVARWYSQFTWKGVFDYLLRPLVLVDLVVVVLPLVPVLVPTSAGLYDILPAWLFSSASLINLRLLRILRLQRVLADMKTFSDFQMALGIEKTEVKPYKLELARVVLSVFTLLSVSTGLIYSAEHNVNPDISTYFDALYFTLTTLTTVGFGDIVPITGEGKVVVSGSILAGVAVIPAQAAALVEALLAREEEKASIKVSRQSSSTKSKRAMSARQMRDTPCPTCAAENHWMDADYCWSCGSTLDSSWS